MSSLTIGAIVFACVFGSGLLGLVLRHSLPDQHLSEDSMGVVKLGAGLLATLSALVLGLLIASAKASFDRTNEEFTLTAVKVIMLDRKLAQYGPEPNHAREMLRQTYESAVEAIFSAQGTPLATIDTPERLARWERIERELLDLVPKNDRQRFVQSEALALGSQLAQTRWLMIERGHAIPRPFLVVLVLWMAIIFLGFGLVGASNGTVIAALVVCAFSVSGAIFLIEELDRPLHGLMQISSAPARNALSQLGRP